MRVTSGKIECVVSCDGFGDTCDTCCRQVWFQLTLTLTLTHTITAYFDSEKSRVEKEYRNVQLSYLYKAQCWTR